MAAAFVLPIPSASASCVNVVSSACCEAAPACRLQQVRVPICPNHQSTRISGVVNRRARFIATPLQHSSLTFTVSCGPPPAGADEPWPVNETAETAETAELLNVDVDLASSSAGPWLDDLPAVPEALEAPSESADICREIDTSFRLAWHYLNRNGADERYCNQLAMFSSACLEMYKRGFSPRSLELEMAFAGIPRMVASDRSTLRVWFTLVFRVFQRMNVPRAFESPSEGDSVTENSANLHSLVDLVIGACARGFTLETLKLEMALKSPRRTALESVLLSQWMRLTFIAMEIISSDGDDVDSDDFPEGGTAMQ